MTESRQIIERWHQGSASILITLIRVQGSSYRQPGARSLICNDGRYAGSISAGCLEADLLRKAAWLSRDGAMMERYSTLFDESAEIPFGLGCGGVLDLLIEPVATPECRALLHALERTLAGEEQMAATWLPSGTRTRLMRAVFRPDGHLLFASEDLPSDALAAAGVKLLHHPDTDLDGVFVERLQPPQRLFIFGAGDDAIPLVTMAGLLGWRITVADGRAQLARKARFAGPAVEVLTSLKTAAQNLSARDAVVIMTHSYEQDRACLAAVLPSRPRYLGLLGSRQRSSLLIAEAAAQLDLPLAECCEQISAPAGLDLGGEGPEAIALAILAECQACCEGSRKASRKLSAEHVRGYLAGRDPQPHVQPSLQPMCRLGTG